MPGSETKNHPRGHFATVAQGDVPQGRRGKHKEIVSRLIAELESLRDGRALKVPLNQLGDKKENVRAALNRAIHQHRLQVATSTDDQFLYMWRKNGNGNGA